MQYKSFISTDMIDVVKKSILLFAIVCLAVFSAGCKSNKSISKEAKMQLDSDQQNFRNNTFNKEIR